MSRSILISDDDAPLTKAIARLARCGGFLPITDTHSKVVELAEEHHPNLIVLDIEQKVDGRKLLGTLKMNLLTSDIPVIVLTGNPHKALERFCRAIGACDFMQKPIGPSFIKRLG